MQQNSLEVVQLFDIDLSRGESVPDLRPVFAKVPKSDTYRRLDESFDWLFDPQEDLGAREIGEVDPTLHYLSQDVNCPNSLPKFDRFSLVKNAEDDADRGGSLTISRELRIAVLCTWQHYDPPFDALRIKLDLDTDIPMHYRKQLARLVPNIAEAELMFPFIALRYDSASLQEVLSQDSVILGRLFSGGLDHETDSTLTKYLDDNLSIRKYEGLFIRSSDALGVYVSGVENPEDDLRLYENTLFRAVQVCEVSLLAHRMIRSFRSQADHDALKVRIFPRPFLVEKRRNELLSLEMDMIKSLPFRSPEALPLIRKAQQKFNVVELLGDAKDSYSFLEARFQNSKATALAAIALLAYICDKMHVWDWLSRHLLK